MDRRNFFKIVSTASAGVMTGACGKKADKLIPLLVSDPQIIPGEEQWHPSVCTGCSGGCGTIARVMEGERTLDKNGETVRQRIACVKKVEGNPLDPVSGGRLCARGQALVQSLYHPDRLQGPMRRSGDRGNAQFTAVSWNDAIAGTAEKLTKARAADPHKILFLTGPARTTRTLTAEKFTAALGAPPPITCSLADFALESKAVETVFGWKGLPVYDLAKARYALGIGADFVGGWVSPVYYARQFGNFRQGRPDVRGRLVQAESRMSLTAASADQWLPIRPGTEPHFAIAIARILLDEKLARNVQGLPQSVLLTIQAAEVANLIRTCGVDEKRVRRVARELGESEAPLVIAGASAIHTNSLDGLIAANYLNLMLGNVGQPGGLLPPAPKAAPRPEARNVAEALTQAQFIFLDSANPVYALPVSSGIAQALLRAETIVSFGSFIDDSAAYADFLLPDHHTLEAALAVLPAVAPGPSVSVATPFVRPLYNTRSLEEVLGELGGKTGITFEAITPEWLIRPMLSPDLTFDDVAEDGGVWLKEPAAKKEPGHDRKGVAGEPIQFTDPTFSGAPDQFPFQFQPYLSLQFHDGASANLPWMQELPDPVSSAMWGLPVEIDPQTAAKLQIKNGDLVRVESPHGKLDAPAYIHPAALPGVLSMAVGQGHSHYGRYASHRGANPLSILAPVYEKNTGSLAIGATRVRLARLAGSSDLIQFSANDRERGTFGYR